MLDMTQVDQKNVWKYVRQIRKSFLSQNSDPDCQYHNTLLSDNYIKDNIDIVEEKLKLTKTTTPHKNVSNKSLKFSANIFTYLNFCPTKDFYVLSVTKSESAKNILLALTSMMKTSQNAGKKSHTRIFTKAMKIFKLNIYRDIDEITKGKAIDVLRNGFKHYNKTMEVLGHYNNLKSSCFSLISGSKGVQRVTNHPVHIKDQSGNLLPTSLIPFCDFGGDMSVMGVKIDQFDIPVCNSFRPKTIKDQLCYTVDPNEYKDRIDLKGDLSLSLFINYNEDREMASEKNDIMAEDNVIRIDTIGSLNFKAQILGHTGSQLKG